MTDAKSAPPPPLLQGRHKPWTLQGPLALPHSWGCRPCRRCRALAPLQGPRAQPPLQGVRPGARVVGAVALGDDVSIWFNAVLRGDNDAITVGGNAGAIATCTA